MSLPFETKTLPRILLIDIFNHLLDIIENDYKKDIFYVYSFTNLIGCCSLLSRQWYNVLVTKLNINVFPILYPKHLKKISRWFERGIRIKSLYLNSSVIPYLNRNFLEYINTSKSNHLFKLAVKVLEVEEEKEVPLPILSIGDKDGISDSFPQMIYDSYVGVINFTFLNCSKKLKGFLKHCEKTKIRNKRSQILLLNLLTLESYGYVTKEIEGEKVYKSVTDVGSLLQEYNISKLIFKADHVFKYTFDSSFSGLKKLTLNCYFKFSVTTSSKSGINLDEIYINCKQLKNFKLTEYNGKDVHIFSDHLIEHRSIKKIKIIIYSINDSSNEGSKFIEFLNKNKTCTKLFIKTNQHYHSIMNFVDSTEKVIKNSTLQFLYFCNNTITLGSFPLWQIKSGINRIYELFSSEFSLEVVEAIRDYHPKLTKIQSPFPKSLIQIIQLNSPIITELACNNTRESDLHTIHSDLYLNQYITSVHFEYTNFDLLKSLLISNKKITKFSCCSQDPRILILLTINKSIKQLDISLNSVSFVSFSTLIYFKDLLFKNKTIRKLKVQLGFKLIDHIKLKSIISDYYATVNNPIPHHSLSILTPWPINTFKFQKE